MVVGLLAAIPFLLFVIYSRVYTAFVLDNFLVPLGIRRLNDIVGISLGVLVVAILPVIATVVAVSCLFWKGEPPPQWTQRYLTQVGELDRARANLSSAINYLDALKKEIDLNQSKQEELIEIIKKLDSVSKESAAQLRSKLEAVELVTKWREVQKLIVGFLVGVLASLLASAIWSVLNSRL